jgi:hypothetical protein
MYAKPNFLSDDIIHKVMSIIVQKGYYQDPLLVLKEAVSAANANITNNNLEAYSVHYAQK